MKKQAITLGRVGILLPIIAIIPFIGTLASVAALVLLLISHYNFSKVYEKVSIFNNMLTGAIIQILGSAIGMVLLGIALGKAVFSLQENSFDFQHYKELIFESGLAIIGAIVLWAGLIIGMYFIYQGLKNLAEKSEVHLFKTAGLLYFIGAIASIILIGGLVIFVGWIVHIIAYFTIQTEPKTQVESAESQPDTSEGSDTPQQKE
ncbi:MAG: DUF996 domain-containing protein [Bacteroidales bacterium]